MMRLNDHSTDCAAHMGCACTCGIEYLLQVGEEAERQMRCRPDFYSGLRAGALLGAAMASIIWIIARTLA